MRFANEVNGLVVKFLRLQVNEALGTDMLVMERIYPIDFRAYKEEMREIWFDAFADELQALHQAGFVHRDLLRPSNLPGDRYDNILLTPQGLRLIDEGISVSQRQVGESIFSGLRAAGVGGTSVVSDVPSGAVSAVSPDYTPAGSPNTSFSIQRPSSRMSSIRSSTARSSGTAFFITSWPR